jgi:aspartyl/glutamyl-tRNA(Asn/Gln) amidotransferase C subunit
MASTKIFDKKFILKMADLAKLSVDEKEADYLSLQFNKTLATIDDLKKLNTSGIPEAYNITGLTNVFREDKIDKSRILTQKEALLNAKRTHNGYFVVKGILDEK